MSERVEIPVYCDMWMRGARYGDLIKVVRRKFKGGAAPVEIAYVKLDITGKTVRVVYADCKVL